MTSSRLRMSIPRLSSLEPCTPSHLTPISFASSAPVPLHAPRQARREFHANVDKRANLPAFDATEHTSHCSERMKSAEGREGGTPTHRRRTRRVALVFPFFFPPRAHGDNPYCARSATECRAARSPLHVIGSGKAVATTKNNSCAYMWSTGYDEVAVVMAASARTSRLDINAKRSGITSR